MPRGVPKYPLNPALEQAALFPDAIGVQDCLDLVINQINEIELVLERMYGVRVKLEALSGSGLLFHAKFANSKTVHMGLDLTLKL